MSSKGRLLAQAITESRVLSSALTETTETPSFPITKKYANIDLLPSSGTIGDQAFVESTNRLYIWNGNGWYNIALINTNPSFDSVGAPESSYLLELNDSGYISPLTITLLATDPEGVPIQYSALLSDSASNFVTVAQDSSVFTITPKSVDSIGEFDSSGGEFTITFRASDGVNLATVLSEFTINLISGWDLNAFTYSNIFLDVSSQSTGSNDLYIKGDGSKLFVVDQTSDSVYSYTLTVPYDISSALYDNISVSTTTLYGSDTVPQSLYFKPDGTKMYIGLPVYDRVIEVSLSSPWDISSSTYSGIYVSGILDARGIHFSRAGDKLYTVDRITHLLKSFTLSTPWDLSSATDDNTDIDFSLERSQSETGIYFKDDGLRFFVVGYGTNHGAYQYELTIPWDISTASYSGISFFFNNEDGTPQGIFFTMNGSRMYMIGSNNDSIYQYDIN